MAVSLCLHDRIERLRAELFDTGALGYDRTSSLTRELVAELAAHLGLSEDFALAIFHEMSQELQSPHAP